MSTQNIPFRNTNKKIILNYSKSASMGFVSRPKNEFDTAVVNEPSVFEPLKFYCVCKLLFISALLTNLHIISLREFYLNVKNFNSRNV